MPGYLNIFSATTLALVGTALLYNPAVLSDSRDKDHDLVPDTVDACPATVQLRKFDPASKYAVLHTPAELSAMPHSVAVDEHGCELDRDGDKVADSRDYCPDDTPDEIAVGVHPNGCPLQSDGDGTPDYRDRCPSTPRGVKTDQWGCPVDTHH